MNRASWAQDGDPSRPVQVWVGFPGGGALDVATPVVTTGLVDEGIKPIVVMNKPEASGIIASTQVARDKPDGYSLLLSTSANTAIAQYVYSKPGFDRNRYWVGELLSPGSHWSTYWVTRKGVEAGTPEARKLFDALREVAAPLRRPTRRHPGD